MHYINTATGMYPISFDTLVGEFPNTSFPPDFAIPSPYAEVHPSDKPTFNKVTQYLKEGIPVLVNGKWQQTWLTVELFNTQQEREEAIAAATNVIYLNTQASIISAVQARLDAFAQTKFYDGILSACTYATSSVPKFALEGQYAISARDATWNAANSILEAVIAGTRPAPSGYAEIEGELPVLAWPVVP